MPYNYFAPKSDHWFGGDISFDIDSQISDFNRKIPSGMKISAQDQAMLTALAKLSNESRNSILNDIITAGITDVVNDLREIDNIEFIKKLRGLAYKEFEILIKKHFKDTDNNTLLDNHILRDLDLIIEHRCKK